jgi:hypothetical protein
MPRPRAAVVDAHGTLPDALAARPGPQAATILADLAALPGMTA